MMLRFWYSVSYYTLYQSLNFIFMPGVCDHEMANMCTFAFTTQQFMMAMLVERNQ